RLPAKPTGVNTPLGSRLPGPFCGCSGAGSHHPGSLVRSRSRVLVLIAAFCISVTWEYSYPVPVCQAVLGHSTVATLRNHPAHLVLHIASARALWPARL